MRSFFSTVFSVLHKTPKDDNGSGEVVRLVNGVETPNTDTKIEQTTAPAVEKPIYGEPIFSMPKNQTVSEKFGRRSVCALDITVPIIACGIAITASVWSRLVSKADGDQIDSDLSMPRNVSFADPTDKEAFQNHIGEYASQWPAWERTMERAENLLTNAKPKSAADAKKTQMFAPRLVKKAAAAPTPAGTV